ncbi:MAG: glycoside hydrolase family 36 N-terminal domain-containing protein, partial [Pseudomonadota bacterium]
MADNAQTEAGDRHGFSTENQGDVTTSEDLAIPQHGPVPAHDPAEDAVSEHEFFELRAGGTLVAIEASHGMRPIILYAGPDLPGVEARCLELLATRQHAPGSASVPLRGSIINEIGTGISGPSGLVAHRAGQDWAIDLRIEQVQTFGDSGIAIHCHDTNLAVAACHKLTIDPETGVLTCSTSIDNHGQEKLELDWCAALCLPIDQRLDSVLSFTGRWPGEFAIERIDKFQGSIVRENKAGRTSHDAFPGGIAITDDTSETRGLAVGYHLAWSGNHRLRIDRHSDGRSLVQMGEMTFPGEIRLGRGESYTSPQFVAAWSEDGLNGVSRKFQDFVRGSVL